MSIETCVAHAIHTELDILECRPDIADMPVDKIEDEVEKYIRDVNDTFCESLIKVGEVNLKKMAYADLVLHVTSSMGTLLPGIQICKMVKRVQILLEMKAKFIMDLPIGSLYYVQLELS